MSIIYTAAATAIDPLASFSSITSGTVYEELPWLTTPIDKAVLEAWWVGSEKQKQINAVSNAMTTEVTGGFMSDVLQQGTFRRYDSDLQGQILIVGAVAFTIPIGNESAPTSFMIMSTDSEGSLLFHEHDRAQLHQLLQELGNFANTLILKLQSKIIAIMIVGSGNVQNDLDAIHAITWTSVES
jgi:hypothetical protein